MKSVLRIVLISTSRFLYIAYFVYFTVCIFSLLSVCLTTSLAIPLILILSFYPFSNELLSINSSPSLCCSKTTIPLFTKLKYQFLDYPLKFNVLFSFGEVILTFFFLSFFLHGEVLIAMLGISRAHHSSGGAGPAKLLLSVSLTLRADDRHLYLSLAR